MDNSLFVVNDRDLKYICISFYSSLLDMISSAERNQSCKRLDFSGRLCTPLGQTAKLYPDFGNKDKDALAPVAVTSNLKDEAIRS